MDSFQQQESNTTLKVLMASTSYPRDADDWRSIFIRHLTYALARRSDLELSLWSPPGETPPQATYLATAAESAWLAHLMAQGGIAQALRQKQLSSLGTAIKLLKILRDSYRRAGPTNDIYHINWLQTALPLPLDSKPALITVLGSDMKLLKLPFMRPQLRKILRGRAAAICPNADWMVEPLTDLFGDLARIQCVPFGVDSGWYSLERRCTEKGSHWLTVLRITKDKIGPLFSWGKEIFDNTHRTLHLFGPMQEIVDIPPWVIYHGAATSNELMKKWFPSARGLISLSEHAEGRPQVMLEAMAAGLPIVASPIPAHRNLLQHGETGFLCATKKEFEESILQLENADFNRIIGNNSRISSKSSFGSWDDCASRFVSIYRALVKEA